MNIHAPARLAATSLSTPLTIQRPRIIEFGAGTASLTGRWAAEQKLSRILVVADAFNAGRVDVLELAPATTSPMAPRTR